MEDVTESTERKKGPEQAYAEAALVKDIFSPMNKGQHRYTKIVLAECKVQDNLLYHQDHLYVAKNNELRRELMREHHKSFDAGHSGIAKTLELLSCEYN